MLVTEGFEVSMQRGRRPHVLRVDVDGSTVWSFGVWKRMPAQAELAQMVRNGV
jgi:hypothetical protein